ncbi:MAG: 2-oxoglutarate dehydrogenase E1 component [Gemmatimonadota bacterium]
MTADSNGFTDPYNAAYAEEMFERWRADPDSVPLEWRRVLALRDAEGEPVAGPPRPGPSDAGSAALGQALASEQVRAARAAAMLVDAYRLAGHQAADVDPLGRPQTGNPMLDPEFHGLTSAELAAGPVADIVAEVLEWLRSMYCGTIGYEFEHLEEPERREWMLEAIEGGRFGVTLEDDERLRLLDRLTEVEGFEQFLHRAYLGQKRFSIEGLDMLVPMLDLAIERAAAAGAQEVVLGMAHRGRLNVLTHVLGRPYERIFADFEGHQAGTGTGDVKYHAGAEGTYATASGQPLTVALAPNPSHLEAVNPVVEGVTRARQEDSDEPTLRRDARRVVPILIHGDAAFSAQGVVAETLNMAELDGYATGGTLHLIANNQIGFTTLPRDGRSTYYASDLALGFDIPVIHVNADDPEACLTAVRIALAYREAFGADFVIDLVGYRRYGHNEGDEPAYTQPLLYQDVAPHPTVRALWERRLIDEGLLDEPSAADVRAAFQTRLQGIQDAMKAEEDGHDDRRMPSPPTLPEGPPEADTALPPERIRALDEAIHSWPDEVHIHDKLARQLERRAGALAGGEGPVDWAHAEALAFASLVAHGTPVRLTGQDSERGTFSQRHLVLHDVDSGEAYCPLAHVPGASAPFSVHNSPLSEVAALGFEYGYSTAALETLVLWEAQFGDFVNGAQVIIDQFLVAGRAKWAQEARLVLLLPHGYEGQGPEHSSARIERFLQLAAEDNIRVANCTTPAQYFHLLRLQALETRRRPLVVFTPKSLLRHPKAVSTLPDFTATGFQPILGDPSAVSRADRISRLILCSGKVYYDLLAYDGEEANRTALARLELLYPFPKAAAEALLATYPALEEVVWAQEEPRNMGGWHYVEPRIRKRLRDGQLVRYAGRPGRASPAEGSALAHREQQAAIVRDAFGVGVGAAS